ncbi:T9SS type A sorting domain-containing protein [Aquimarina algiphila]|uniref:T9SS type A sorting domain-containing protein n=1 Tax=Aquimarina algiphila TaxID=2047982 RepID=UPI00232D4FD6|nr:T9SS type A sorting domain-containing protein [Aquimarina algiphila]
MKKLLFYLRRSVWAVSIVGTIISVNAQQPKLSVKENEKKSKPDAHRLYKEAKMIYNSRAKKNGGKLINKEDDAIARAEFEFERLKNPYSNEIPQGIRNAEIQFSGKIQVGNDSKQSLNSIAKSSNAKRFSYWENRGPWNVGGRTRALAIDRNNENVILAGGVSGGLWRSENGGQSWRKVTRRFQSPSITTIVQDPRPGRSFTWYYGSGEDIGNSASLGTGAFYQGNGVYKSQDGGRTWEQLRATVNTDPGAFNSPFNIINSLVVNPVNGDLFVATFDGLLRSQDGGNSFTEVLESGFDNNVEISVTSTGILYANIDSEGDPNAGFFTSVDGGDTWENITPQNFIPAYGRTKAGIDPSNEDIVYFLTRDLNPGNEAVLYRYDASAETPEEAWTDLTANLPTTIGGRVGNLNLQTGYNMVVKVSPADPNLVFVGGTNLYRSTTGFTTPAGQESWIAGYSPLNNVTVYTDQHPDQHELVFYPSNPNRVLTGSDGGVAVTEDITATNAGAEPVDWTSLNNGYLTTQPYHVSFDPEANSDDLLAGFQDNSTWYTNSTDPEADWEELFGGDGGYSAIADGGRTRYVSSQRGNIFRQNYNEAGEFVSSVGVTPPNATGFFFIAPFILDHNNDNIMYLPAGNRMWRNNNLDELEDNWVELPNSDTPAGTRISSLDVSKYPVANRLYYGTNQGGVYRMDNANIDDQEVIDITTGKGLPIGTVNDINVDPSNSDRVIITFSNYGIISLFLTENAGETWTNISGNLEENRDGSGNGPSVRSTAFFGGSQGFFGSRLQKIYAATSTGLYYTNRLMGENTVWRKEQFAIGNAVTDEVVTRKDGFIAVAAHGNGLFSARFPIINELPESALSVSYLLDDLDLNINNVAASPEEIDITDLFVQSNGEAIDIEFENSNPGLVTATLEGNTIKLVYSEELTVGDQATISLVATSGNEQVAEGFTITVVNTIYDQGGASITSTISQFFPDFGGLIQSADDFVVPTGTTWNIERILAFGGENNRPALTNATVVIYQDNEGVPGQEIFNSGQIAPISEPNDTTLNLALAEPVALESGNYWISIYVNLAFNPGARQWFWSAQSEITGNEALFRDELGVFGSLDWTSAGAAFAGIPIDQIFQIFGTVQNPESNQTNVSEPLATIDTRSDNTVSPNPSADRFTFNFDTLNKKTSKKVNVDVYNLMGSKIYSQSGVDLSSGFVWDATSNAPGIYFVNVVDEQNTTQQFKVIKK